MDHINKEEEEEDISENVMILQQIKEILRLFLDITSQVVEKLILWLFPLLLYGFENIHDVM